MLLLNVALFCLCFMSKCVNSVPCEYIEDVIRGNEDTKGVLDSPTNTQYCTRHGYKNTDLALSNSTIGILRKNAVRNMPWLKLILCDYCKIDHIEPGTFQNVSSITGLYFSHGVLTEIRRGVFDGLPNLDELKLMDNSIYNIDDGAFSNLPALKFLSLEENEMEYWRKEWFVNTTDIFELVFSHNQLHSIPPLAFTNFKKIQYINFNSNKISVIHRDAFKGVKSLRHLGLADNRLTTLSETAFPNNIKISILDIHNNNFNYISSKVLGRLTVDELYLELNPWKCQCWNLINFWLNMIGGKTKSNSEDPLCNGPELPVCISSSSSTCLESVDEELSRRYFAHPAVVRRKNNPNCIDSILILGLL